ncbi:transposase [Geobacillus stearothermophilus]|uniref:transposase n=1 Tax=Geobacillus stearothermophilus TaxID=1422 RepID=UPI003D25E283
MITKETEDAVLLYIDETHIRSYHVLRSTWSEVGRQKQVPTFGHHAHVSRFGAVNVHDGETVLHQTTAAQCRDVLGFLENAQRALSRPSHRLGVGSRPHSACGNG